MEPTSAMIRTKDCLPVEVAGLDLTDGGVAPVVASGCGTHSESALSEVEAVANGAAHAIKGDPANERWIDPALQNAVFDKPANGVVGQSSCDRGAKSEATSKAACNSGGLYREAKWVPWL